MKQTFDSAKIDRINDQTIQRMTVIFGTAFPFLTCISVLRAFETGWQPLYSVQVGIALVALLLMAFRKKLSYKILNPILVSIFVVLGTASALRNNEPAYFLAISLVPLIWTAILSSRRTLYALMAFSTVLTAFITYWTQGWHVQVVIYALAVILLMLLPLTVIATRNQAIEAEQARLTQLLAQQNQELQTLNETLEKRAQQQNQMFAIIGHELRTPAATLKMLQSEQSIQTLQPYGAQISKTTDHLLQVLDDMRVVIDPESAFKGREEIKSVHEVLTECIQFTDRLLQEQAMQLKLEIDEQANTPCFFNTQLMRQVSLNLIKNAAFHSQGDELLIRLTSEDLGGKILYQIDFIDNGRGISLQDKSTLFDAFSRGDTHADGSGLGLHLSKEFAQKHLDGDLEYRGASAQDNKGARFTLSVRLTRATEAHSSSSSSSSKHSVLKNLKILVAEDNEMIRFATELMLKKAGAKVVLAEDGLEALGFIEDQSFDVVLTDIFMPNMNGYELTTAIRDKGLTLPIIAASEATIGDEMNTILKKGADSVIAKPISVEQLETVLAPFFESSQSNADLHAETVIEAFTEQATPHSKTIKSASHAKVASLSTQGFIDLLALKKDLGNDMVMARMLNIYHDETQKLIKECWQAFEQSAFDEIKYKAHRIKGSALYIMAHPLSEYAYSLQRAAESNDTHAVNKALQALETEFRATITHIETTFPAYRH